MTPSSIASETPVLTHSRGTVAVFAALLASFFFHGLGVTITGSIQLIPADIVVFVLALMTIAACLQTDSTLCISRYQALAGVLLLALVAWHIVHIATSPQPLRGSTLTLLLIRGVIIVMASIILLDAWQVVAITRLQFWTGALISLVMLPRYIVVFVTGDSNSASLSTIHYTNFPPRAQWFVADPNFFALLLFLSLFAGLWEFKRQHFALHILGLLGVIGATLVTTFSRTMLGLTLALGGIVTLYRVWQRSPLTAGVILISITACSLAGVVVLVNTLLGVAITERVSASASRWYLWEQAIYALNGSSVITGTGLRSVEMVAGRYVHNSYLKFVFEMGIFSLVLLGGVYAVVARGLCQRLHWTPENYWLPWAAGLVALLAFNLVFTFVYLAPHWLIIGLLLTAKQGRV